MQGADSSNDLIAQIPARFGDKGAFNSLFDDTLPAIKRLNVGHNVDASDQSLFHQDLGDGGRFVAIGAGHIKTDIFFHQVPSQNSIPPRHELEQCNFERSFLGARAYSLMSDRCEPEL